MNLWVIGIIVGVVVLYVVGFILVWRWVSVKRLFLMLFRRKSVIEAVL